MATETTNFKLIKDASTDYYNIDTVNANLDKIDKALGNTALFEKASGTATAITLTGIDFVDGHSKTFVLTANNNGANTTINGKPLYKPGTKTAPNLISGRAVTVWYDAAGDCFFIKASASGTATPSDVLAGVPFSNEDGEQMGEIPVIGKVNINLPVNGTYNIPEGYHNGNGKVTQSIPTKNAATYIPSSTDQVIEAGQYLAGDQIIKGDSNLIGPNIAEGKSIFNVKGSAKTVTSCAQISNLSVTVPVSGGALIVNWTNPSDGKIKGVRIMIKAGSYPTSPSDGSLVYDSNDGTIANTANATGLTDGVTYYIRGFAYTYQNATRLYTTTTAGAQTIGIPQCTKGQQIFTSSGIFTVPYAVYSIQIFVVGGGGGGGASEKTSTTYSGSGGGGGYTNYGTFSVTPGQQLSVVVGAGGTGQYYNNSTYKYVDGTQGGTSSVGSLISADGGYPANLHTGGNGGSGGGVGTYGTYKPSNGGSDGSDGLGSTSSAGKGQHATTRAFGESSNTLYAGGGGGGGCSADSTNTKAFGGAGGGGDGGTAISHTGYYGTANTGGGGGGGYNPNSISYGGGNGGSGIVIIRWGY